MNQIAINASKLKAGILLGVFALALTLGGCASADRKIAASPEGPCYQTVDGKPVQGGMFCEGSAGYEGHLNRVK